MSAGSVTSGSSLPPFQLDIDGLSGPFTDVATEIAVLALESQENQKQSAREELASARDAYTSALHDEVASLKAAADARFAGAVFQAGTTIVASGFGAWGAARDVQNPWQSRMESGLNNLAAPLGAMVGNTYGEADAKAAEGEAAAAKWQLDDARQAVEDAGSAQNKALDWLEGMVERDAATTAAVLSNKV